MVDRNHTRARTRVPHSFREGYLAGELTSTGQRWRGNHVLLLNDGAEPRDVATSACLYVRHGRRYLPASADAVLNYVRHWAADRLRPGAAVLDRPEFVEAFLLTKFAKREKEVFALILLDGRHRFIDYVEISHGTRDSAPVQLCDVVRTAVRHNAQHVVLVHNHPSGRVEPSPADLTTTQRIKAALAVVEVRVIDHFIVGETILSFARRGLMS